MGKMKELFIEQMNNQVGTGDEDFDFESHKYRTELDSLNESMRPKYSESDIKYVLDLVLGDVNPLNEKILYELNELHNLRHEF